MGTVIVMASGKGGTGKTACCAGIGSALARLGHTTLCMDCDVGLRNLDLALGLADAMWDFEDVLCGDVAVEEAVVSHPALDGLSFLAAPWESSPADIDRDGFRRLLEDLRERYEYVLLDAPAGLGSGFEMASERAELALIVVNPDVSSLRDGQRTAEKLRALGVTGQRLIINRVEPKLVAKLGGTLDDAIDAVGARLLGVVSEDESVRRALGEGVPLMVYGARSAYGEFMRIARRLTGERVPLARL